MGMKSVISDLVPMAEVCVYQSCEEMEQDDPGDFIHFFVSANCLLEHVPFFRNNIHRTIVLVSQHNSSPLLDTFRTLNIQQPENMLVHSVLRLFAVGHSHMRNIPTGMPPFGHPGQGDELVTTEPISQREAEVLALVAKGYINKEIADKLNISLNTVVTHRKNITEKLKIKSVSALTIYAVTHGIVRVEEI